MFSSLLYFRQNFGIKLPQTSETYKEISSKRKIKLHVFEVCFRRLRNEMKT